ncbi:phosphoglycerate mutase family protein [Mesorhizobium sp. M0698]|uniref:histidine phosphatase family protein n=1 Tax=Mesorhizobium sp. M0698 TaxID=2956987 RepID=UPI0033351F3D
MLVLFWIWGVLWPITVTTVFLVRHAEKADNSADPPLSPDGAARAQTLAHTLVDAGIDAVFVTNFVRAKQTGAPTASAAGVTAQQYQAGDVQGVVGLILLGRSCRRPNIGGGTLEHGRRHSSRPGRSWSFRSCRGSVRSTFRFAPVRYLRTSGPAQIRHRNAMNANTQRERRS